MKILDIISNDYKFHKLKEFVEQKKNLVIFDIDDTLLHTTAKIKVIDQTGKIVRDLSNQEFNNYVLKPGEQFDFGEFRDAEKFSRESTPIQPMMDRLKDVLANSPNAEAIMLTARADFDNKQKFLDTFKRYGVDMSRVHVHRAGNLPGDEIPAEKKAIWVRKYLNTGKYKGVWLYDDSRSNLSVFKTLRKEYPDVNFHAIFVGDQGSTTAVENMDHSKDDRAVPELKTALVAHRKELQSADDDKVYNIIDKIMTRIAKSHGISGQKLHDMWVAKYGQIPDTWVMKSNGSLTELKKGQKDSNGYTKCWPGKHAEGTKKGKNGKPVRNCVPNESLHK